MPTNRAYDKPAPTIHPRLTEHSQKMAKKVYKVTDGYYLAYGYGLASTHMIVGNDGIIIIDPVECVVKSREIYQEFRKITDKPVKAIIYTHMHGDHVFGVKAFVSQEEVDAGSCEIIAHETMIPNLIAAGTTGAGKVLFFRTYYTFGNFLESGPEGRVNGGIGPDGLYEEISLILPTRTVKDVLDLEIVGVKMHIFWVPSECDDEIAVWFPQMKVLCSAEVIQGETFPNLHSLRGTRYRDPKQWYKSIDLLRTFDAEHMAPSHGRPVTGRKNVAEILTAYRDAIQFVHNQTIRYMNKGYTPDELVELVKLPDHLAYHPWLGEFYGTVKHSVRQIYQGELGWFNGDPTTLDPTPPKKLASRHVALMGGRDRIMAEARKALDDRDYQWAAELTSHIIRMDKEDMEARKIKASALRELGYKTMNINWRNWYLTSARELEGTKFDPSRMVDRTDVVGALPSGVKVEAIGMRLAAENALDLHMTMGFHFPDSNEHHAIEIRRGIAQFHPRYPDKVDVALVLTETYLGEIIVGKASFEEGLRTGKIKVEGKMEDVVKFFGCIEKPKNNDTIFLTQTNQP